MMIILIAAFISMASADMTLDSWNVIEKGARVQERIMTDLVDGVQKIVVPKHNTRSKMTIYNDFKDDVSVYKIHSEKRCYVMELTEELKKTFKELHESIKNHTKEVNNPNTPFNGLKESDYVLKPKNLLAKDDVDFKSAGGILAVRMCGTYNIVRGVAIPTDVDVNTFAMEQLKKSVAKRTSLAQAGTSYDLPIRDLFTCSNALYKYAMEEMARCDGSFSKFKTLCKFRKSSCVYIVSCPYDDKYHYWKCKGKHNFTNIYCCEYECTIPKV